MTFRTSSCYYNLVEKPQFPVYRDDVRARQGKTSRDVIARGRNHGGSFLDSRDHVSGDLFRDLMSTLSSRAQDDHVVTWPRNMLWRDLLLSGAIRQVLFKFADDRLPPPTDPPDPYSFSESLQWLEQEFEREENTYELVQSVLDRPEWTGFISKALALLTVAAPPLRVWNLQDFATNDSNLCRTGSKRLSKQLRGSKIARHYGLWPQAFATTQQIQKVKDRMQQVYQTILAFSGQSTLDAERDTSSLVHMKGSQALTIWKNTAGANKSWRRCPTVFLWRCPKHRCRSTRLTEHTQEIFMSRLWIPQIFERYPPTKTAIPPKRIVRVKRKRVEPDTESWASLDEMQDLHTVLRNLVNDSSHHPFPKGSLEPDYTILGVIEPAKPFMRLVWKRDTGSIPVGQLDRFLLTGLLLMGRWRVLRFIRNESHADVYSVEDMHSRGSRRHTSVQMEAHFFMAQYSGNWRTAAKRKQNRLLRSERFQANFYYGDRCMVILKVNQLTEMFDLRQRIDEFPVLGGRKQPKLLYAQSEHRSYAEVLRQAISDDGMATRTEIHQLPKTVSVKKMRFPSLAEARRAEKQRLARRAEKQRLARLEQRQAQRTC